MIFKVSKEKKIFSFVLASTFLAYFTQNLFLFDNLAVSLGLFPFLAFLVFLTRTKINTISENQLKSASISVYILVPAAFLSLFIIYTTVFLPWKANNAVWQFFNFTEAGFYKEVKPAL